MLDRIRSLFDRMEREPKPPSRDELHLAAAALMMEAARTDDSIDPAERARVVDLARRHFHLSEAEARDLAREAEDRTAGASHNYDYIRVVIDHCPPEQRVWIIEMLWEIAYADGELHHLEANLLRRIGGLLAVSDQERGAARKRVLRRMGLPEDTGI